MNVVCLRMTFFMFRPIFYLMITYCMKGIYFVVFVISIRWYQKRCNLTQVNRSNRKPIRLLFGFKLDKIVKLHKFSLKEHILIEINILCIQHVLST